MSHAQVLGTAVRAVVVAAVAITFVWVWGQCQYSAGGADALLRAAGDTTDARVARLAADIIDQEAAWVRERDRLTAGRDSAQHIADSLGARIQNAPGDVVPKAWALAALEAKDKVIARYSVGIATRDARILFLTNRLRVYTDTIVPDLTRQRDAWEKKANRRFGCAGGVSATVGYAGAGNVTSSTIGPGAAAGVGVTCGLLF